MRCLLSFVVALTCLMCLTSSGQANFGLFRRRPVVSYFTPVSPAYVTGYYPVYSYSAYSVVVRPDCLPVVRHPAIVVPQPQIPLPSQPQTQPPPQTQPAPSGNYAVPSPAPPSGAGETAIRSESRRVGSPAYDTYFVANGKPTTPGLCAVMFWNQSGQALNLAVGRDTYTIAAGRSLKLDLKHQFAWRIVGQEPQLQRVPTDKSGLEIVIRSS